MATARGAVSYPTKTQGWRENSFWLGGGAAPTRSGAAGLSAATATAGPPAGGSLGLGAPPKSWRLPTQRDPRQLGLWDTHSRCLPPRCLSNHARLVPTQVPKLMPEYSYSGHPVLGPQTLPTVFTLPCAMQASSPPLQLPGSSSEPASSALTVLR